MYELIRSFRCWSERLLTSFSCQSFTDTKSTQSLACSLSQAADHLLLAQSNPSLTSLKTMQSAHLWNAGNVTAGFPELPACRTNTIVLNDE